jgi:hypothetical protein
MAYTVHCVHADRQDWAASLRAQLGQAVAGLDASASTVRVLDGYPAPAGRDPNSPAVVVYLGSPVGAASAQCSRQVSEALADHLLVLPCVSRLASFSAHTPEPLHRFNGLEWPGKRAPAKVVHFVLEALGLEERQRRVFLSHRRSDALVLAEQLHDRLVKRRRLRDPRPEAVLIHATSRLSRDSSSLLQWCLAGHDVRLITDLRVGKDWMRPSEGRQQ